MAPPDHDFGRAAWRGLARRLWPALVLMAMEPVALASAAAPPGLCFEHVGPQDKPMPEFCLVAPAAGQPMPAGAAHDIAVSAVVRAKVDQLCTAAPATPLPLVMGSYRVVSRGQPPVPVRQVGPQTMRQIMDLVQADFRSRSAELPALVMQLQRRLAPTQ